MSVSVGSVASPSVRLISECRTGSDGRASDGWSVHEKVLVERIYSCFAFHRFAVSHERALYRRLFAISWHFRLLLLVLLTLTPRV